MNPEVVLFLASDSHKALRPKCPEVFKAKQRPSLTTTLLKVIIFIWATLFIALQNHLAPLSCLTTLSIGTSVTVE